MTRGLASDEIDLLVRWWGRAGLDPEAVAPLELEYPSHADRQGVLIGLGAVLDAHLDPAYQELAAQAADRELIRRLGDARASSSPEIAALDQRREALFAIRANLMRAGAIPDQPASQAKLGILMVTLADRARGRL